MSSAENLAIQLLEAERKLRKFRQFRAQYQAMLSCNKLMTRLTDLLERDNARLIKALKTTLAEATDPRIRDYLEKVLGGVCNYER